MKLYNKSYLLILCCLALLTSCSLLRPKCKIEKCHILKTHTHPHVFDAKKFKGEKRRLRRLRKGKKAKLPEIDSTQISTSIDSSATQTTSVDSIAQVEPEKKLTRKEKRELKKKAKEKDDLGPEAKEDNKEDEDNSPGWEDELWENGDISEEDEDEESEEEAENTDDDE